MTAISSLLSSTAAMPPPVTASAATPSLASFLDLLAPITADLMPEKRQADAAPGKTLPVEDHAATGSEDALAWLGVAVSSATAMVAPSEMPVPGADGSGVQATGSIETIAGMTRVGAMQPSPVEPLVAPRIVPLPGSDEIASMKLGARTLSEPVAGGTDAALPSSTAFTMQQTPASGVDDVSNTAVPERSVSHIGNQPFASEPLVGHVGRSAVAAGAMTASPPANEGGASLMSDAPASPVLPPYGANLPLSSPIAFTTQPAPVSVDLDGSNNADVSELNLSRTSIAVSGASLGDAGVAGQVGAQAIARGTLGATVAASTAEADAIATSSGRWSRLDGGSVPHVGGASAPGNAVAAALRSQAPVVQHRFAQMSGAQLRVGIDLPNVPAVAPIAVSLPGVNGTATATQVAGAATGEAPLAQASVSAIGSPVRPAGEVIISNIGQSVLGPVAPAAIEMPVIAGERVSAAASIVQPDTPPTSRFLPVGVLATGTPVEPRAPDTAAPAALVFADAIHHALSERDSRGAIDPAAALAHVAPALPGVAAIGTAQGALDLRHEHWPAAMIERIVSLRDMAAENDTRLRLSPDMLGTIDVSLRRDGDQVQVQISAEQAQTRQLLAEAQPRLAELADARGVKLQLTGAPGGSPGQPGGGDASRQQPAPAAPFFTRPRSVAQRDDAAHDERIA